MIRLRASRGETKRWRDRLFDMPVRPPSRVSRPPAAETVRGVAPERPGPVTAELTTFEWHGETRQALNTRYLFTDAELVSKGRPGNEVTWRVSDGASNPLWDSWNNRSDPQLLRAQARFLELSKGTRNGALQKLRTEMLVQVKARLASGLDEVELNYVPKPVALAVVKRLAIAARVPLSGVRVLPQSGRHLPESLKSKEQKRMSLAAWESLPAADKTNKVAPLIPKLNADGAQRRAELEREVATMTSWFEKNPRGTLADYSREQADNERHIDHAFWSAMQDMFDRADLAELAGPGGVGGRGAEWFSTETVRPRPQAGRGGGKPNSMTPLELVSHPSFVDYLDAKSTGFRGSFSDFIKR